MINIKLNKEIVNYSNSLKQEILKRACFLGKHTEEMIAEFLNKKNRQLLPFIRARIKDEELAELLYLYEESLDMIVNHALRTNK